jgi:hypothetical protein
MAIIGINGYAGSGKDTIGTIVQYLNCHNVGSVTLEDVCKDYKAHQWWLEDQSGWKIKKWAGKLKTIATMLTGIPQEKFEDQEFKKTNLGPEWNKTVRIFGEHYDGLVEDWTDVEKPMTVRDFLQRLGTDGLRNGLHPNVWVNALMADYKKELRIETNHPYSEHLTAKYPNWIITDTRFPNEAQAIKDKGGIIIRVDRPGVRAINTHPSETALDNWNFDYKIANVSDLVALETSVLAIFEKANLL